MTALYWIVFFVAAGVVASIVARSVYREVVTLWRRREVATTGEIGSGAWVTTRGFFAETDAELADVALRVERRRDDLDWEAVHHSGSVMWLFRSGLRVWFHPEDFQDFDIDDGWDGNEVTGAWSEGSRFVCYFKGPRGARLAGGTVVGWRDPSGVPRPRRIGNRIPE